MNKQQPTIPENPYLAARREWLERYGSYIKRERMWMYAFFGALLVAALCAGGLWSVKADQRVLTYVIETDSRGAVLASQQVVAAARPEEKNIRAALIEWVEGARTVYVDMRAIEKSVNKSYAYTLPNSDAMRTLSSFHKLEDPYKRASRETVEVVVKSALPMSGDTWTVEWDETVRPRGGGSEATTKSWKANVLVEVASPTSPQHVALNSFGIFVKHFSWAERL